MSNIPLKPSPLAQPPTITLPDGTIVIPQDKRRPSPLAQLQNQNSRTLLGSPSGSNTPSLPGTPRQIDPSERLLPPGASQSRRYRDDDNASIASTNPFADSRRNSWGSDAGSRIYSPNPFGDSRNTSRAPSRAESDEDINTQTVSEKYNILPSAGLLLFPEDVEKDDYMHNPDPNDKDRIGCDICNKRGMTNMFGMALMFIGILALFIIYPTVYGPFLSL